MTRNSSGDRLEVLERDGPFYPQPIEYKTLADSPTRREKRLAGFRPWSLECTRIPLGVPEYEMNRPPAVVTNGGSADNITPPVESTRTIPALPWSRSEKVFVPLALGLFLALSIASIQMESVTNNEVLFIPAGLSYLQRHDGRMDFEEPPLVKVIIALPALLAHPKLDYSDPTWTDKPGAVQSEYYFGQRFFESWNARPERVTFLTRLAAIFLTLLLGFSLYWMARRLAGPWGAALVLTLFATSPFFISYGSLVHTDVPIALFSLWTMWSFASLWQEPTKRNALLLAGSLAGALLTKFSGVFLLPAMFLAWAWFRYLERRSRNRDKGASTSPAGFRRERLALGSTILAGIVVYIFYLGVFYRSDPRTILNYEGISLASAGFQSRAIDIYLRQIAVHPALDKLLLPPALYEGGLIYVLGHEKRPLYFLGHWHPQGVWFYFPVISFFKLAPGMILVFVLLAVFITLNLLGKRVPLVPN
jgi:Dolichyl-phosphate-mannose-protein mannosyltransferase